MSDYLERAMSNAEYGEFEDGSFFGRIPTCKGVFAFAPTLGECEDELRSTLQYWFRLGQRLGHDFPTSE